MLLLLCLNRCIFVNKKTKKMHKGEFVFGIYPGGAAGSDNGVVKGAPDNPVKIIEALDDLSKNAELFLVRGYLHYLGNGEYKNLTPLDPTQYLSANRKMDLVLGYQSRNGDINDWKKFIRNMIGKYQNSLAKIQITEEPNLNGVPYVDGDSKNVRQAVVEGVIAAKDEVTKLNIPIQVGFNGVPTFNPDNDFWRKIGQLAKGTKFYNSLDYIGLDFFPDVFRPIPDGELETAIEGVLHHYRTVSLSEAGISMEVPLHITENGWATSPERTEKKQAEVLETNIRTIYALREKFNITHYEMFDLRDADSSNPDFFHQFGIMKDDYTPKLAYNVYKTMIRQFRP